MKNVPNILSLIRLLMVPLFVWLFLSGSVVAALVVFILAGATDVADGFIARRYNCTSTLGKILDPLADKAMQLAAFLCLWYKGYVPGWMPVIYLVKELATVIGAFIIFRKTKFVVKSNFFGKLATVLVFGAVFVIAVFGSVIGEIGVNTICVLVALYFMFSCGVYCGDSLMKMIKSASKKSRGTEKQ